MAGEDWRKSKLLYVISAFKKKNCFGNIFFWLCSFFKDRSVKGETSLILFTASSNTLEYSKLVQHIFVWHMEIYIQYNRLVYEINKDTKFA
jgi:hypothetical protein